MPDDPSQSIITLSIGYSPDADDAFMWWPLGDSRTGPSVDTGRFRFEHVTGDIDELNTRAIEVGDLDITAISMHTYAHVHTHYALTDCGSSMGDGYGPKVVAPKGSMTLEKLTSDGVTVAVPGEKTSAFLGLSMMLGKPFKYARVPFEEIAPRVASGDFDAGVVIHDAQLTFPELGLELVADLGEWWKNETGLPMPLGGNAVSRDLDERLGEGTCAEISGILRASIEFALANRGQGLGVAKRFAEGTADATIDEFVSMYVNDLTISAGERGARAVTAFLERGASLGLCPSVGRVEMV
ncbi:MAG: MqnA/MqnD/SBP family protein [Phycisphaerales bacterium]